MGVPVITLSGCTYVSRMSTAVLCGAGLFDWVTSTEKDYFELALRQVDNIKSIRNNRDSWRQQLMANPLGRADLLMSHIELAFSDMFNASL